VTAQALPKTQELSDRINTLFLKKRKPSEFDIRLLKKEAEKLKNKTTEVDYCQFLGLIAALENDKENCIIHYERAIKLSPNDYDVYKNYCICLHNRGLLFKEIEQLKELIEEFPSRTTETLLSVIENKKYLCRFKDTLALENKTKHQNFLLKESTIFENAGLSDDEAQYLCKLAYRILETKKLYFSYATIEIIDDCVLYTIYVDLPIEEIFKINWELAGIFAENVEDMRSDVLMFEYSSVDVLEEKEKHERLI
jgi:tetratricopeptide (TPR) repeat protein